MDRLLQDSRCATADFGAIHENVERLARVGMYEAGSKPVLTSLLLTRLPRMLQTRPPRMLLISLLLIKLPRMLLPIRHVWMLNVLLICNLLQVIKWLNRKQQPMQESQWDIRTCASYHCRMKKGEEN